MKKIFTGILTLSMIMLLGGCGEKKDVEVLKNTEDKSKLQVVVSFNPMREFVEAIGKDKVNVKTIVPEGSEAHEFEPKVRDLESINKAKVFIYNGAGMEHWVDKSLKSIDNKNLMVVEVAKGLELIKLEHQDDDDKDHDHGEFDPHVWLSLKGAQNSAMNIKEALIKVDVDNKEFYEKNYNEFALELQKLYYEYKSKFDTVSDKNFVTGHAAFAYLCRDFGLKQKSVEGVFAEGEPSAKNMKELIDFAKANKIKTIFVEDMVSPKVSETLAKEVGAKTEKISTIENREENKDYIKSMRENLDKIYNSLK